MTPADAQTPLAPSMHRPLAQFTQTCNEMTYAAVALVTCSTEHHRALPCCLLRCYVRQRLSQLGLCCESSSEHPHLQEASGSPALCTPCHIMRLIALSKEKCLQNQLKCFTVGEAACS